LKGSFIELIVQHNMSIKDVHVLLFSGLDGSQHQLQ
jgi:hypothetical protein